MFLHKLLYLVTWKKDTRNLTTRQLPEKNVQWEFCFLEANILWVDTGQQRALMVQSFCSKVCYIWWLSLKSEVEPPARQPEEIFLLVTLAMQKLGVAAGQPFDVLKPTGYFVFGWSLNSISASSVAWKQRTIGLCTTKRTRKGKITAAQFIQERQRFRVRIASQEIKLKGTEEVQETNINLNGSTRTHEEEIGRFSKRKTVDLNVNVDVNMATLETALFSEFTIHCSNWFIPCPWEPMHLGQQISSGLPPASWSFALNGMQTLLELLSNQAKTSTSSQRPFYLTVLATFFALISKPLPLICNRTSNSCRHGRLETDIVSVATKEENLREKRTT